MVAVMSKVVNHPQSPHAPNNILIEALNDSEGMETVLVACKMAGETDVHVSWSAMDHEELAHLAKLLQMAVDEELGDGE
jgi:hypothetical protein